VTIVLVVYGPALKAFHAVTAGPETVKRLADFSRAGLQLNVCSNTMKAQEVTLKDLLPGFVIAEGGGVVRLAELQSKGYVYIKP
jgi:intracellular sulfur oxidation DsrE/DsrF family protein